MPTLAKTKDLTENIRYFIKRFQNDPVFRKEIGTNPTSRTWACWYLEQVGKYFESNNLGIYKTRLTPIIEHLRSKNPAAISEIDRFFKELDPATAQKLFQTKEEIDRPSEKPIIPAQPIQPPPPPPQPKPPPPVGPPKAQEDKKQEEDKDEKNTQKENKSEEGTKDKKTENPKNVLDQVREFAKKAQSQFRTPNNPPATPTPFVKPPPSAPLFRDLTSATPTITPRPILFRPNIGTTKSRAQTALSGPLVLPVIQRIAQGIKKGGNSFSNLTFTPRLAVLKSIRSRMTPENMIVGGFTVGGYILGLAPGNNPLLGAALGGLTGLGVTQFFKKGGKIPIPQSITRGSGSGGGNPIFNSRRFNRFRRSGIAKKLATRSLLAWLLIIGFIGFLIAWLLFGWFGASNYYNLQIIKSGPPGNKVENGQNIDFQITVSFQGPTAADLEIIDPIPKGTEFVAASLGGIVKDGQVVWSLTRINPSESKTVTFTVKPLQENVWITNMAQIKIAKKYATDLGTVSKGGDSEVENNQEINYEVNITYSGIGNADIVITDPIPQNTEYIQGSASDGGNLLGNVLTWDLKQIPANSPKKLTFKVKPLQENIFVENTAEAKITGQLAQSSTPKPDSQTPPDGGANQPPNQENCAGGKLPDFPDGYKLGNPIGNFGDPSCNFSKDKLHQLLKQLDPTNADYWFLTVARCESNWVPNAYANHLAVGTPDSAGAWGLFQMGRGKNGELDHGDVPWQKQTTNAVGYNNNITKLGLAWRYWQCAKNRW
jgi:uncharacterized repeat protein (TIGR01451 family)